MARSTRTCRMMLAATAIGGFLAGPTTAAAPPEAKQETTRSKIVGGVPVDPGVLPWQVSLFRIDVGHFCGGTLIAPQWVLTAAHCLVDEQERPGFRILSGTNNLRYGGQISQVERVILHEAYNGRTHENDIALVKLSAASAPRMKGPGASVRTLPISRSRQLSGSAVVSGFGIIEEDSTKPSAQLLMAEIPVVPNEICNGSEAYNGSITPTMLCAGVMAKDSCQGDSGGPLVAGIGGSPRLVGVVSWGEGCGRENRPGVYTRVDSFADWIARHMN